MRISGAMLTYSAIDQTHETTLYTYRRYPSAHLQLKRDLMEFSLWLVPPRGSPEDRALRTTIETIVTFYKTPAFPPHVTLIGGVEGEEPDIKEKTATLAAQLTSYEIQFSNINSGAQYFKKLYLQVTPSSPVMKANATAQKMFDVKHGKYLPHCSLAYGDVTSQEIAEMQVKYVPKDLVSRAGFTASRIQLWDTSGAVKDWQLVRWFPFGET